MIIYELDDRQIAEWMITTWKDYCQKTEDLIIVSTYNLSYLQGVRYAAGVYIKEVMSQKFRLIEMHQST